MPVPAINRHRDRPPRRNDHAAGHNEGERQRARGCHPGECFEGGCLYESAVRRPDACSRPSTRTRRRRPVNATLADATAASRTGLALDDGHRRVRAVLAFLEQ